MLFPPPQVIFGLLLLSIAVVLIWDIRYNPFGEDEDGIRDEMSSRGLGDVYKRQKYNNYQ